jgi:hypothetical protein
MALLYAIRNFCQYKEKTTDVVYFDSTISLIAVRSSPSMTMSTKAGIQTKFLPLGATKPLAIAIALIA